MSPPLLGWAFLKLVAIEHSVFALFPKGGRYIAPVRVSVRKAEGLEVGRHGDGPLGRNV